MLLKHTIINFGICACIVYTEEKKTKNKKNHSFGAVSFVLDCFFWHPVLAFLSCPSFKLQRATHSSCFFVSFHNEEQFLTHCDFRLHTICQNTCSCFTVHKANSDEHCLNQVETSSTFEITVQKKNSIMVNCWLGLLKFGN